MTSPRVLLVGGGGFIGSHLAHALVARGGMVSVLDNFCGPHGRPRLPAGVNVVEADARDADTCNRQVRDCDICVLLAAHCSGVPHFSNHPAEILDTNASILSSVFRALANNRIPRVIYVSSPSVYNGSISNPISEEGPASLLIPPSGYPFSKLLGEIYCDAYQRQFGLDYSIVRPFNVYGPGDGFCHEHPSSHVIPELAFQIALEGADELRIRGSGKQVRSFTHISDIVAGFLAVIDNPASCSRQAINFCSTEASTVLDLAQLLWRLAGRHGDFKVRHLQAPDQDISHRSSICTKARKLLNWNARVLLASGLQSYLNWLSTHCERDRIR